ncbi:hypothetical protein G6F59_018923 [Rhizopus arrhizus]|nr:hypothetical protein G6F59_018923 [Rhizopus arrhizus]
MQQRAQARRGRGQHQQHRQQAARHCRHAATEAEPDAAAQDMQHVRPRGATQHEHGGQEPPPGMQGHRAHPLQKTAPA